MFNFSHFFSLPFFNFNLFGKQRGEMELVGFCHVLPFTFHNGFLSLIRVVLPGLGIWIWRVFWNTKVYHEVKLTSISSCSKFWNLIGLKISKPLILFKVSFFGPYLRLCTEDYFSLFPKTPFLVWFGFILKCLDWT